VEWQTEPARGGVARVAGYVRNDSLRSAVNLHLRVDRLAPDGGIAATYRRQMAGVINPGDRAYFEVGVPERDATYRVTVEAFDWFRCGD
jgi:hypothetical protein